MELISPPNRSSESVYQRFKYFCMVGRSIAPNLRNVVGMLDFVLFHEMRGALHHPTDAGFADEHVMRFFGEHEARGA